MKKILRNLLLAMAVVMLGLSAGCAIDWTAKQADYDWRAPDLSAPLANQVSKDNREIEGVGQFSP